MKNLLFAPVAFASMVLSVPALAAPGEYWEITTKMEMAGMPFAMPATTHKVCLPQGAATDPKHGSNSKDCDVQDMKVVGNKTTWKMRCTQNGEVMEGTGEATGYPDRNEGKMHFSGKSGGRNIEMNQSYSNRRVGGACETDAVYKSAMATTCDTSSFDATQWISNAERFLKLDQCPGKKAELCNAVRKDLPRNAVTFGQFMAYEDNNGGMITKACDINVATTTQAACKTFSSDNADILTSYCPTEAKAFKENGRRKDCEGRAFTAKDALDRCLSGEGGGRSFTAAAPAQKQNTNTPNPTDALLEGAKKLKGLFGF